MNLDSPVIPSGGSSPSKRSNSVPFPSEIEEGNINERNSSSSNITTSDKLTALPPQSTPLLDRVRASSRSFRRSADASVSLTSIDSTSGSFAALHSLPGALRQSESEASASKDTPRQRNESERSLPASFHYTKPAVTGRFGHSDSLVASPSLRSREESQRGHAHSSSPPLSRGHGQGVIQRNLSPTMPARDAFSTPPSRSPAQSRAASPFRGAFRHGFNLHRNNTRDDPFIPPDPFSSHIRWFGFRREGSPTRPSEHSSPILSPQPNTELPSRPSLLSRLSVALCSARVPKGVAPEDDNAKSVRKRRRKGWRLFAKDTSFFLAYTLPRILYLHFLLHLPALYWQRVARVFEDAELSKPEMQRLIDARGDFTHDPSVDVAIATGFATPTNHGRGLSEEWTVPPALARFKVSWESFVDTLMREWKTFNLVSALLCTTILTIFQIPEASGDPITRWSALLSLVCALISLSFGCVYIVHFGTMRSMDRASRWAEEARKTRTALLWNIWVLLATPAVWLAWSMIAFLVAILSFVWRTGSAADPRDGYAPLNPTQALGVRLAISVVFAFGLVNFYMIISTFSSYSDVSVRRKKMRRRFTHGEESDRGREQKHNTHPGEVNGREREREKERDGKHVLDSMVGLGLSGLGQGSPAGARGTILANVDLEKGEVYLAEDRLGGPLGKTSPMVSPKL